MHRIDPRIVIIQIVLSGICAFWIFKPLAMLCEVIFLMSFLLYLQHPKEALRLGVWFAFLVGLYALLNESNAPQIICEYKTTNNHSGKSVWETGNHFCNRCFKR